MVLDNKSLIKRIGIMLFAIFIFAIFFGYGKVKADGSVSVKEINYDNSTITVQMGSGDTALMISDDKQKKWETVTIEPVNGLVTMDISWITLTKDYVLSLKGDVSNSAIKVTIPKQNKDFKATYSPTAGLSFTGNNGAKIEWKKKEGVTWMPFPDNPENFKNTLDGMIAKGCSVMFRTAPVNGNGTSSGQRPSKEVTLNIKARTSAPAMQIDNEKMTISLEKNMEYRYCDEKGNVQQGAVWTGVDSNEERSLASIAAEAMADGSTAGKNVYIQFRKKATDKTQISNIATITIPGQVPLTSEEKEGISIEYTTPSSLNLKVAGATDKEKYEYCILTDKDIAEHITIDDVKELVWVTVSDNKAISITKSKAGDGSQLYVRKKAKGKLGDEDYSIPSPYVQLADITYPKELSTLSNELVWMSSIAGMCRSDNESGHLTFFVYSSIDTPISNIKLVPKGSANDSNGIELSSEDFTSTARALTDDELNGIDPEKGEGYKYSVTTVIKDTSKLETQDNRTYKEYYVYYKQGGSGEFKASSESEGGNALCIYPKTVVKNPDDTERNELEGHKSSSTKLLGDQGNYVTQFTRVYNSNWLYQIMFSSADKCDPHIFNFVLDLGSKNIPKTNTNGATSDTPTTVTKLVYDGVTFNAGAKTTGDKPYFVLTNVDYEEDGVEKRKIIVTVDTSAMEKNTQIKPKGEDISLDIYLNDGEVIKDAVKIKFIKTGVVVNDKNETAETNKTNTIFGPLDDTVTQSVTVNGVTTTTESDVFETVIIYLNPGANSQIELENVTLNGTNICKSIKRTGNYFEAEISRTLLNKVLKQFTTKTSKYLSFKFSNNYTLSEGYKIVYNPNPNS